MTADIQHLDAYESDWLTAKSSQLQTAPFRNLSSAGWESFKQLGFPTARRGSELWKYTDIRPLNAQRFRFGIPSDVPPHDQFTEYTPSDAAWRNVVTVDGKQLGEAADAPNGESTNGRYVDPLQMVGTIANLQSDPFVALNTAFMSDIQFLVADDDCDPVPAHFSFLTTGGSEQARASYPRLAVQVSEDASLTLIETHASLTDDPVLEVPVVEIDMAPGSSLTHYRVQLSGASTYHIATTRLRQAAGSSYRSTTFATGAAIGRHDVHAELAEGAESIMHGLYITNGNQHQANEVSTTHTKPRGTSHQFYKGILSGKSQAVFSGKIVVERGAQKTDAQQKDLNLLLSHGAEIDTKPSLEIYADDVQCSHGATAGHVDEETLFYLQSRGVDYSTAQAMLIRGFAAEILDEFEPPALRQFLEDRVDQLLPELQAASDTIGTA